MDIRLYPLGKAFTYALVLKSPQTLLAEVYALIGGSAVWAHLLTLRHKLL
jgi:hypothetical protein